MLLFRRSEEWRCIEGRRAAAAANLAIGVYS